MVKRQKWLSEEDMILKSLLKKYKKKVNWEKISEELENHNILKNSKQCRERWIHQLDPSLNKKKWTIEENKKLFELHTEIGNKWKVIAQYFEGRTDNTIKNQFFSIIRRGLRIARKILGKNSNTTLINKIKPSSLSEFIKQKLTLNLPDRLVIDGVKVVTLRISSFIQRFGFRSYKDITSDVTDKDKFVIRKLLDKLLGVNAEYVRQKIKKKQKIKKLNGGLSKIIKNLGTKKIYLNNSKKEKEIKPSPIDKISNLQTISKRKSMNTSKINKNKIFLNLNKSTFSSDIQNLLNEKKNIEKKGENQIKKKFSKKELIQNFDNLGENIYKIKELLLNTSQKECDEYFNQKRGLGLSFFFPKEKSEQSNNEFFKELIKSNTSEKSEKQKNNINSINFNRFNSMNSRALKSVKGLGDLIDQKDFNNFNLNDFNNTHNGKSNGEKKYLKRRTTNLKIGSREGGFKRMLKNKNTVDLTVHKRSIEEFDKNFLRNNMSEKSNNFNSILSYKSNFNLKKNYDIQDVKYNLYTYNK